MKDLCLKFTDEAQAKSVLFREEAPVAQPVVLNEDGTPVEQEAVAPVLVPKFRNTDVIGSIFRPTGEVDAEGVPVLADVGGWHVNVLALDDEDVAELEPFVVQPAKRQRVWA